MIYVSKIVNRITFRTKTVYYLNFSMSETLKLLESNTSKVNKNENCENVPHLEITDVVLVHCNVVNKDYQHDWFDSPAV